MINRLRGLGIVLGLIGLAFVVAGGFAFFKVQEGTASLKAFSAAQGVELAYNEDGQLVDRGEPEGARAIMGLLTDDWGYPVVTSELDPADPVVNTHDEELDTAPRPVRAPRDRTGSMRPERLASGIASGGVADGSCVRWV